jgi:hypothetical protein
MACCADDKLQTMPWNASDINNVPRLAAAWKLQKQEVDPKTGQITHSKPWRTQENHMKEWCEIINRFVPVGGTIWDPTCGTMASGLAALRMGRAIILSDIDSELVEAATWRLKYYWQWLSGKLPIQLGAEPRTHDGMGLYRFHNIMLTDNNAVNPAKVSTLPSHPPKMANGMYPEVGTDRFEQLCESHGVKIMDSNLTAPNGDSAGQGLFLVKPKVVGDPWDIKQENFLRLPYRGVYTHKHNCPSDRYILVHPDARTSGAEPVYVRGATNCLATYINDPRVLCFANHDFSLFEHHFFLVSAIMQD